MKKLKTNNNFLTVNGGFTLIELLIVIGIIAVLAAFAFVALNPLARFADARNARRWADVNMVLAALKLYQVDHNGRYNQDVENLGTGVYYQIGKGDNTTVSCLAPEVTLEATNVDLDDYVSDGYMPSKPIDPSAEGATFEQTFYYIFKGDNGVLTVGACAEEQGSADAIPEISVSR